MRWMLAILQLLGVISVLAGAAMMYLPAAFVLGGVGVILVAQGMARAIEGGNDEDTA